MAGPVIVAPSAAADVAWAAELSPAGATVIPQSGGNLGQRINAVDRAARADGHSRLLFIGSDAPVLNERDFRAARAALTHADVVLGPAADGGVTAMGSTQPWPDLQSLAVEHAATRRRAGAAVPQTGETSLASSPATISITLRTSIGCPPTSQPIIARRDAHCCDG